jgi:flagellar basal body P-ring formation protein FlgA
MKIIFAFAVLLGCTALNAAEPLVPVASRILERGTILGASDIESADPAAWSNRIIVRRPQDIVGKELKRPLNAGEPFRSSDLKSPTLVKRGQVVTLLVSSGGLQIAASGRAMQDGSAGDYVKAQNTASRTIVEGELMANGMIRIDLVGAPRLPDMPAAKDQ